MISYYELEHTDNFIDYLNAWDNFIKRNNINDWNDEDEESKPITSNCDNFVVVNKTKKIKKTINKVNKVKGVLLKWMTQKNFGFIVCDKYPNTEIFCHGASFSGTPVIGKKVLIEIGTNSKGIIAKSAKHN